jgi:two-component system sensor histidine kinase VicK
VTITQDRTELFAPIHRALRIIVGLGSVLFGLLVFLGTLAGKRLVRPILELQRGADILASGDLTHRLQITTRDELEALAGRINRMAESLQQQTLQLMAAGDYLRNIIEQSAALIITTDPSFGIREFNHAAQKTLQYRRDQILLRSLEMLWDDPEEFRQIIPQLMNRGQRISYETTFARKDGTPVPVVLSITQLTDHNRNMLGLVVVGEDIRDRKELEQARLKAERLMALHRLSTVLTHDLRSPMVGILKALVVLQETYGKMPEDQAQQFLSDLVRGGDLLIGTLNDLLDVYRHSLSALPLRYTGFSLREAIEEIIRLIVIDAQARGVKLEVIMDSPELVLFADRRRIQRVIFNLLDNAVKHSPSGCPVTLQVSAPKEGQIHLQIEDQGPGIAEGESPRIFDFLYEAGGDQTDRVERGGLGVGLYFCRVTIEAHGGRIWAENRPQGGARFTICLPLANQQSSCYGSKS